MKTLHDRAHEVSEVLDGPNFNLRNLIQELIFESTVPDRRRNIQPRKCGALLSCNVIQSSGSVPKRMVYLGIRTLP